MTRKLPPEISLKDRIRARILTRMHLWGLAPGERLPGVRELARETGADHRAVAQAYRELEQEGLVKIRGRSGVFVSSSRNLAAKLDHQNLDWLAGVLEEARRRRIRFADLHQMVAEIAGGPKLRCAFFECNEDQLVAYSWELRDSYSLDVTAARLPSASQASGAAAVVTEALQGADLAVTTRFHAPEICPVADALGVPTVVVAIDADASRDVFDKLRERLKVGPITMIVADALFIRRLREIAEPLHGAPHEIRYVLAENRTALTRLDPREPVIITRAALAQLGNRTPPILMLHAPLFAPESIRDLCANIARLSLRV